MISRRMRHHAALRTCVIQHKNGVGRAASLKGADLLKILALEKQFHSARFIEPRTGQDRRAMNVRADPLMRRADTIKVKCQSRSQSSFLRRFRLVYGDHVSW